MNQGESAYSKGGNMIGKISAALLVLGACALAPDVAKAQNYPSRPVLVIAPFSPGSGVDIVVRLLANNLNEQFKTSFVVENRLGAAGMIGTTAVSRAAPDGYTLLYSSPSHYINQSLYRNNMTYDPVKDFRLVARICNTPLILVVPQAAPVDTLMELIAYIRARPGKLDYSSAGRGGVTHLPAALLSSMANLDITHVPYKDGSQAVVDVMRGQILMTFIAVSTALPRIRAGSLKAIAVAGATRSPSLPNVPTIAEGGLPGYQFTSWNGMFAPTRTPQEVVTRLEAMLLKVATAPEFTQKLLAAGLEPEPLGTQAFMDRLQTEIPLWAKAIEAAGITAE